MDNRLDEREFARMLRTALTKVGRVARGVARKTGGAVSNWANASYEKGQAKISQTGRKKQQAAAVRKDGSPWHDFRDQGPV
jgi:hypothetical protein